ncbi:hypothetical protein D3C72_1633730 [compost metagenome]
MTDDAAAAAGAFAGGLDERLAAQFDDALAQLGKALDPNGQHRAVVLGRGSGRGFEPAEDLFIQTCPRLGRGDTRQAEMTGQSRPQQHAAIRERQHADQFPAVGIQATDHPFKGRRHVALRQRCAADMIGHLIIMRLNVLDQQDQPRVVHRFAEIAQLLDIVNPTAVVPHHYYA